MSIILFIIVIALLAMIISSTVRIVPQAHAYVVERLDLVTERIHELAAEPEVCEPFRAYFKGTAAFIVKTEEVLRQVLNDSFCSQSRETLQKINEALYEDILPEHYKESYANPDYACETLGEEYQITKQGRYLI